jgi:hypothetical protein
MSFLSEPIRNRYSKILQHNKNTNQSIYSIYESIPQFPNFFFTNINLQNNLFHRNKSPIDVYFFIQYELHKLSSLKKMILNILKGLEHEFKQIQINPTRYMIRKKKNPPEHILTIQQFLNPSNENKDIQAFTKAFEDNNYSLFEYVGLQKKNVGLQKKYVGLQKNTPFYIKVIKDNYKGKAKNFVIKLLKEYHKTVSLLQNHDLYQSYPGLLAFHSFFEVLPDIPLSIIPKKQTFVDDFNENFENENIYNRTRTSNESQNINNVNSQSSDSDNFLFLNYLTNIYQINENEQIVATENENKMNSILSSISNHLESIYTLRNINVYDLLVSSIELADEVQQAIFYYVPKQKLIDSIIIKNKFYQYIQYRIDIYNDYIEEFNQWLKKSQTSISFIKNGKLREVFTSFNQFSKSLFEESNEQKKQEIVNKIHQMRIEIEDNYLLELSEEEKDELQSVLSELEKIIQNQSNST